MWGRPDGSVVSIKPPVTVKSVGVVLDKRLSFDKHVNDVFKTSHWHITAFCRVRGSLPVPDKVAKAVAHSEVSSLVDYCDALYAGTSEVNSLKLCTSTCYCAQEEMRAYHTYSDRTTLVTY